MNEWIDKMTEKAENWFYLSGYEKWDRDYCRAYVAGFACHKLTRDFLERIIS